MSDYLDRLQAYAATLQGGTVEFSPRKIGRSAKVSIIGTCRYENIPTLQKAYELFGPSKLAVLVKPNFDGNWAICVVSIR